ncbi:MAG TPA: hypothetical protein VJU14_03230 [Solirubrobacterales bacterium]|nr:hypothetical protein [Solirubrobacterales bacterium]
MEFLSVVAVVSAVIGLITALLQFRSAQLSQEEAREALEAAREPRVDQALSQGDLQNLGDYFFNTLGRLPLSDYADDAEARRVVSDAVRNVENFLNADRASVRGDVEGLIQEDAKRAQLDVAAGDLWGGLSSLRRQIEITLQKAAAKAGISPGKMGAGPLLRRLVAEDVVPKGAAYSLRRAIEICNRAVHGQPVTGEEAEQALALAADGLTAIESGSSQ